MISIIGYSAMGGALGAGGLGDIAIRYGYQAYKIPYLVVTSIILIIFVQIIYCCIVVVFHTRNYIKGC